MSRRSFLVALAALPLAGFTTGCDLQPNSYTFPGQRAVGDDGYTITVAFDRVENLVSNSNVQLDNVTIGTVTDIAVDEDWKATVELRIADEQRLPVGSRFAIGQKTLLGAQYVEVATPEGGSTDYLADGAQVPVEQTGTYPSTEHVLGAASLLLNNGGLSQISTITGELSTALRDRVPETRDLVGQLNTLLGTLDRNRQDLVAALDGVADLSRDLKQNQAVIGRAIDGITPGLRALNQEREALVRAIRDTGRMSVDAGRVIAVNDRAIRGNLASLDTVVTRLGSTSGDLVDALKLGFSIPFPAMTTSAAIRGDYANLFATLDVSLPSLASAWLGGSAFQSVNPLTAPVTEPEPAQPRGSQDAGRGPASGTSPSPSPTPSAQTCSLLVILVGCS